MKLQWIDEFKIIFILFLIIYVIIYIHMYISEWIVFPKMKVSRF